jgi:simple sugar transport system permease protein
MPEAAAIPIGPKRARRPRFGRVVLELRQAPARAAEAAAWVAALLLAAAVAFATLRAAGVEPADIVAAFGDVFVWSNLPSILAQAAPLVIVGLAACAAFQVRFWNIGIEGQMIFGGLGATAIVVYGVGPAELRLPLMIAASATGGALWALAPALLKFRLGINEIVSTLLLNYVAADIMRELLFGGWRDPKDFFPHSPLFGAAERFGKLDGVGAEFFVALGLTLILGWLFLASRPGYYAKLIHANPTMAAALGLPVAAVSLGAALLSGATAGVAGLALACQEGRLSDGFFAGYGFSGVLIAFLARNNPFGAAVAAFAVAALFDAGRSLQEFDQIPFSVVQLIEAMALMSVAGAEFFLRHRIRWLRAG